MGQTFFIIGCPRSGTTAYAKMLDTALNAVVYVEHPPQLRIESREMIKGHLKNPKSVLYKAKHPSITKVWASGLKYGDKNPCYLPFIPLLTELWDTKIVFLVRDGRDVVRSLMDWHELYAHNIFSSPEDEEDLTQTGPERDPWDYSRLRPTPDQALYEQWKDLSRFQKCAWYWANFNRCALEALTKIDTSRWIVLDVSSAGEKEVRHLFDFLALEGFDQIAIYRLLKSNINSVYQRMRQQNKFPSWRSWSPRLREAFDEWAASTMRELGYY